MLAFSGKQRCIHRRARRQNASDYCLVDEVYLCLVDITKVEWKQRFEGESPGITKPRTGSRISGQRTTNESFLAAATIGSRILSRRTRPYSLPMSARLIRS